MNNLSDVVPEMRERLLANKHGKITVQQWLSIVAAPLVTMLLLLGPAIVVFGVRFAVMMTRGLWLFLLVVLLVVIITGLVRAYRFARAPVLFAILRAPHDIHPVWHLFGVRPFSLKDSEGRMLTFRRRLAPLPVLRGDEDYIVYYLREGDAHVLLSIAPAGHPDAGQWRPSPAYTYRMRRRAGAGSVESAD